MEAALIALLLADPGVFALTGPRIRPLRRPQGEATPSATLQRVSAAPDHTYAGPQRLAETRVQIDVWAARYTEARALSAAICAALDGYGAAAGTLRAAFKAGERDLTEDAGKLVRVSLDFMIWHEEA